ncbi:hypothetical protein Pmani_038176, partial [Petrolisthes manimaculis]
MEKKLEVVKEEMDGVVVVMGFVVCLWGGGVVVEKGLCMVM